MCRESTRNAPGFSVSPHSLSRGNRARSNARTEQSRARQDRCRQRPGRTGAHDEIIIHGDSPRSRRSRPARLGATAGRRAGSGRFAEGFAARFAPGGRRDVRIRASAASPPLPRIARPYRRNARAGPAEQSEAAFPRAQRAPYTAPSTSAEFFDPKPRQLHSAASGRAARPALGRKSRSHCGS